MIGTGKTVNIFGSTLSNNSAAGGGGVHIQRVTSGTANLTITDSTFSGNSAEFGGGMNLQNDAGALTQAIIVNSTIAHNAAEIRAGGINVTGAGNAIALHNAIVAGNVAGEADFQDASGNLNGSAGAPSTYNVIGVGYSTLGIVNNNSGNQVGSVAAPLDPRLAPLAQYGGSPRRHLPLPGSPTIDRGSDQKAAFYGMPNRRIDDADVTNGTGGYVDVGGMEKDRRAAVGDFNGDGWDDVLAQDPTDGTWVIGVNDGTDVHLRDTNVFGNWTQTYVGDFDADGKDDLLVGTSVGGGTYSWSIARYNETLGLFSAASASVQNFGLGSNFYIQDANRDGRDDVISRATTTSSWTVRLAGVSAGGTVEFQAAADWNAWISYGFSGGVMDADKAYAKVIEEFAWVYNNVELELYPGLMKGPIATEQTKAGNDWDQAALLEKKLAAIGVSAQIVYATVTVAAAEVREWLGAKSDLAAAQILDGTLDKDTLLTTSAPPNPSTISFRHAWVKATVPTATGMAVVDLDPSWKFKDRQAGILLPEATSLVGASNTRKLFDEFEYLALNPSVDHRLPVEFFEDQVMQYLVEQPAPDHPQGSSLADVPYDGPIITKTFTQIPAALGAGVTAAALWGTYESFDAIAANVTTASQLTHRTLISVERQSGATWTSEWATTTNPQGKYEVVVPRDGLKTFQITFSPGQSSVSDPNNIAQTGASQYWSRLIVNGVQADVAGGPVDYASQSALASSNKIRVKIEHLAPSALASVSSNVTKDYEREPGVVIAIGRPSRRQPTSTTRPASSPAPTPTRPAATRATSIWPTATATSWSSRATAPETFTPRGPKTALPMTRRTRTPTTARETSSNGDWRAATSPTSASATTSWTSRVAAFASTPATTTCRFESCPDGQTR